MPWTYSGDPTTSDLDAVRFWVQDTDTTRQLLQDAEINYLIARAATIWNDVIAAAALCADVIVARFAGEVQISADGVSVDVGALSDKYRTLAQNLRDTYRRVAGAGAEPIAFGVDLVQFPDFGVTPPSFGKGFTDNPWAGSQEYGLSEFYRGSGAEVPDSGYWTGP